MVGYCRTDKGEEHMVKSEGKEYAKVVTLLQVCIKGPVRQLKRHYLCIHVQSIRHKI